MYKSYFHRGWPPFVYGGTIYTFDHLDEFHLTVLDSTHAERRLAISYSDHCFTRDPRPGDDPGLRYGASTRRPGHFCMERYHHSLDLPRHIQEATTRRVWHLGRDGYAVVPTVDHQGTRTLYGIIFSLDPVKGLPVQLHMRVKSAHPRDERSIITFGEIKFANLVSLRMRNESPKRIMGAGRKKPRLS